MKKQIGDMPTNEFREYGHRIVDWIADYIEHIENLNVLPNVQPNEIKNKFSDKPPLKSNGLRDLFEELDNKIIPGLTHWQHPNFMAYFNSTASGPGILAEFLAAGFNTNGMLWQSSPASNELEDVVINWFKEALNIPKDFWGIIYDTASISTTHALAAARENLLSYKIRQKGFAAAKVPPLTIYTSEYAHSSVEKAAVLIGIGLEGVRKIKTTSKLEMDVNNLQTQIENDLQHGKTPIAIVATIGTTSVASVDPVDQIGEIAHKYNLWLHVDAAYAGSAAILPELADDFKGIEKADSIVINPHKWLYHPIDISLFFTKKNDILKRAFSVVPEYLKTDKDDIIENKMDYGIQLGRRFRALKTWMIFNYFGIEGLQNRLRDNINCANYFVELINRNDDFEIMAPVKFSTICFRATSNVLNDKFKDLNTLNSSLLKEINNSRKLFLSQTKIDSDYVIRLVVSGIRTEKKHIQLAYNLIKTSLEKILS